MAPTIPTIEPTRFTAGDSLEWDRAFADYPVSAGWALTYRLFGPSATPLEISATPSGDVFQVRVAASATAELASGIHTLTGRVELDTVTKTVHRSSIEVFADPAAATTEIRHVERVIASLEAAIETLASQTRTVVTINDRTVEFRKIEDVQKVLAHYYDRRAVLLTGRVTGPSIAVQFQAAR